MYYSEQCITKKRETSTKRGCTRTLGNYVNNSEGKNPFGQVLLHFFPFHF